MKYAQGKTGRIFVVRLEDGEVIHEELERFAQNHGIKSATLMVVGAAGRGSELVVGPKNGDAVPPAPMAQVLEDACEIEGVGTIFPNEQGKPVLHLHIACGRGTKTLTGCARRGVRVWKVVEVVVIEVLGVTARREVDRATGFELLVPRQPSVTDHVRYDEER